MRMIVNVIFPVEPFNSMVRSGKVGEVIEKIIADIKPESIYFSEIEGCRGCVIVVEVPSASAVPAIAEPFFLNFDAHCEFRIAMTPEDLKNAGLDKLGEKWKEVH